MIRIKMTNKSVLKILLILIILLFAYMIFTTKSKIEKSNSNIQEEIIKKYPIFDYQLNSRNEFGTMLESLKFKTMIEIGVQTGKFAYTVLNKWPSFQEYYGIDPWTQQKNYVDGANVPVDQQENLYKQTSNLLSEYGSKIKLIRNYSTNTFWLFKDKSIDFIYIDARHDFCGAYEDLTLFYPKLKCNGIMAGHDFHNVQEVLHINSGRDDFGLCANGSRILLNGGAVKGAVIQFTKEKKINHISVTKESTWMSFFFKKNC